MNCIVVELVKEIEHIESKTDSQGAQIMNAALQITNTAGIVQANLQPVFFDRFISFIDRGEKTTQTYITNLKQFAAWLSFEAISAPVREDILSYRDYLAAEHEAIKLDSSNVLGWSYRTDNRGNKITVKCKPNTVAQYLRTVCQFFRWTASEGLYPNIAENIHAPKIRHDTHKKEALTAADVLVIEKSIAAAAEEKAAYSITVEKDTAGRFERATEQGKRLYAMYLLAVTAGLRTIELERATVKDLQVKGGNACLYVWGKGHSEADARKPLAPEVYEAIKDYLNSRADRPTANSPLFVSTGNRSGGKKIAARTISTMLKNAMKQAGYDSERLTAHSLRHTAGTNIMNLSGDLYTTQKYMRHSNPATTEIYLHNETETQEAALAQQLYNLYHGKEETDSRSKLESILNKFNPQQLEQLTNIAAAMAK